MSEQSPENIPKEITTKQAEGWEIFGLEKFSSKLLLGLIFVFLLATAMFVFLLLPPPDFPHSKIITVKQGSSLGAVAILLKNEHLIRSTVMFEFCEMSVGGDRGINAGDYLFKEPLGTCALATRIAKGITGVSAIKITIPEGTSNVGIANIVSKTMPDFDRYSFLTHASAVEGYLFPETYFFAPHTTPQTIESLMTAEFKKQIAPLSVDIKASGHTLNEIIIMASILEKEAQTPSDQAIVSGILWKRIAQGMPLQVDATFYYLLGKKSSELTTTDLAMQSAYNTYKNKGLPVGPIGNPGLKAIRAALHPTQTPYFYYLSDSNSIMHYAKNFEEHKINKINYLK